ncbi:hypothetical protein DFQ27_006689 [Actinomortierella ambigua]|uniref:Tyr recombinase domain-containing protein n=1 Tax=Actinomortierella ambigua TaxID=1343610 RepID=A0A9P6UC28_9FUNG|nr:hypothetical protein DFQ27_006689 [Actinomortierella ambigua]
MTSQDPSNTGASQSAVTPIDLALNAVYLGQGNQNTFSLAQGHSPQPSNLGSMENYDDDDDDDDEDDEEADEDPAALLDTAEHASLLSGAVMGDEDDGGDGLSVYRASARKKTDENRYARGTRKAYNTRIQQAKTFAASVGKKGMFDSVHAGVPDLLIAFVNSKCQPQDPDVVPVGYKSAESIRTAMKQYYRSEHGCVGNTWRVDNDGICHGNPVDSIEFDNYMKSLKKKFSEEATIKHSRAMTLRDLKTLVSYLDRSDVIDTYGDSICLAFQAFVATGFALWTRNNELVALKVCEVERGLRTEEGHPYLKIKPTWRKRNQDDPSKVYEYEIHSLPEEPITCRYTRLTRWLDFLQYDLRRRPLKPDELVFPAIDASRIIRYGRKYSSHRIQTLLHQFTKAAGLHSTGQRSQYTTHCLRRGGAQHRFMFAKEKWSLKAVKWWGGWSAGEQEGTIMRYLLDEMNAYETGYSDMFSPNRRNYRHTVFMGEADADKPLTRGEFSRALEAMERKLAHSQATLDTMMQLILSIQQSVDTMRQEQGLPVSPAPQPSPQTGNSPQPPFHPQVQSSLALHVQATPSQPTQQHTRVDRRKPVIPIARTWQECVKQWDEGDKDNGLEIPLKDWPTHMRVSVGPLYSQRKLIVEEVKRCGTEQELRKVYGEKLNSVQTLITSIREKRKREKREASLARQAFNKRVRIDDTENDDLEEIEGYEEGSL